MGCGKHACSLSRSHLTPHRFSFLQKHGTSAIFQAKTSEKREIEAFNQKTYLHVVVHLANNGDPIIIRHLKVRDLSLDRDSMTLQCNWRNLLVSAFNMSPQQRNSQAQSIRPRYVWQPAKIDGMPGKWRKGLEWLYTESHGEQVLNSISNCAMLKCDDSLLSLPALDFDHVQQPAPIRSCRLRVRFGHHHIFLFPGLDAGHPIFALEPDPSHQCHPHFRRLAWELQSLLVLSAFTDQRRSSIFSTTPRWPVLIHARGHWAVYAALHFSLSR
jgi:hypothetical protein